jgi:intracellular sulfur oxidation DsrE/DsrF family protein
MTDIDSSLPRRQFLSTAAGVAALMAAGPRVLGASPLAAGGQQPDHDRWLDGLRGTHRTLFDMPSFGGGLPMVHVLNYMNTYNTAYGARDADINVVGTFYGGTTLLAANDAMWAKYRLGELLDEKDPAGLHWTRNPWRTVVHAEGMALEPASIEALQRRGGLFIACNNALTFFYNIIAQARQLTPAAVGTDIRANLLPGVVVVPAMVIAIEKAQGRGLAYNRQ